MRPASRGFGPSFVILIALTILAGGAARPALADVGETYGFGSRSAALAGAVGAAPDDAFAAYSNPGKLTSSLEGRWNFAYGFIYMQPEFDAIDNIVLQNTFTADATQVGSVDNSYPATFGQAVGLSYDLFPDFHRITIGVVGFLPFDQLASMDTGETFIPEYVLFRARTQRPQVELAAAADILPWLHFGVGAHVAFTMSGNADAYLKTGYGVSSMRFSAALKSKVEPYAGFFFADKESDPDAHWTGGLVIRGPVGSDSTINLQTAAQVVGFLPSIPLAFTALSTFYYDPLTISFAGTHKLGDRSTLYAELDFERWSLFQSPAIVVTNPQWFGGAGTTVLDPGTQIEYPYRDIWVPRIGYEYELNGTTILRAGYVYHASIFKSVPDGAGNYLDPDKHMISAGVGFKLKNFLGGPNPWELDLHAAYEILAKQTITKTPGDEAGNTKDPNSGNPTSKVGSPGYDAGGDVYGGGFSLTVEF